MPSFVGQVNVDFNGSEAVDDVYFEAGGGTLRGRGGADKFFGKTSELSFFGDAGNDTLEAAQAKVYFEGGADNDFLAAYESEGALYGGEGADSLLFIVGNALLDGGDGNDTIRAEWGDADMRGGAGDDLVVMLGGHGTLSGDEGNDTLDGGTQWSRMTGGAGDDVYILRNRESAIVESVGGGADEVRVDFASFTLATTNVERLVGTATTGQTLTGATWSSYVGGGAGNDTLNGQTGDDTIAGGAGNNIINGGAGFDIVDYSNAQLWTLRNLQPGGVQVSLNIYNNGYSRNGYDRFTSIEGIRGSAFDDIIDGDAQANRLEGGAGNDYLSGIQGAPDTLIGGIGNDSYTVWSVSDVIVELAGEGVDSVSVYGLAGYTLAANFEKLYYYKLLTTDTTVAALNGNDVANEIRGSDVADVLDGRAGADIMRGGGGNDTYYVDTSYDVIYEDLGSYGGSDSVLAWASFALGENVESLTLMENAITGYGNSGANSMYATSSAVVGASTLIGGSGDDRYFIDSSFDEVYENAGEGADSIYSASSYVLGANIENLFLSGSASQGIGNESANVIHGTDLANYLVGGGGSDILSGGRGDDALIGGSGDNSMDGGDGFDMVDYSTAPHGLVFGYLPGGVVVRMWDNKVITTQGTDTLAAIEGARGSAFADTIDGDSAANRLEGGAGNDSLKGYNGVDTLAGGEGNDTYDFTSTDLLDDVVIERADEGIDTIITHNSHALAAALENLQYIGSANGSLIGNALANTISGSSGDDVIDGRSGADVLRGSFGNDTYYVDHSYDVVEERALQGNDTVYSSATYVLTAHCETLILTLDGINGYGNAAANTLYAIGDGAGAARLMGGEGDDSYYVDSSFDEIYEYGGQGHDTVYASASFALRDNLESLFMQGAAHQGIGNAGDNLIIGTAGANYLDGGAGVDGLIGGAGNDFYVVDSSYDQVSEVAGGGIDTIYASATYALRAEVEALVLTGNLGLSGYGNDLANSITGNTAGNLLDGGAGADYLYGGGGSDTYIVDSSFEWLFENPGEGEDVVRSTVSFQLSANIETLYLDGSGDINGFGNAGANLIVGNNGTNVIDGGGGIDGMIGGGGNDSYTVDNASDQIVEYFGGGTDSVYSSVNYALGDNLETLVLIGGAREAHGNNAANTLIGTNLDNHFNGNGGSDVMVGNGGRDAFVFARGEANGDTIMDFDGLGAGQGDTLGFYGYGSGASLERVNATLWKIVFDGGTNAEFFSLANGANLHSSDYTFG